MKLAISSIIVSIDNLISFYKLFIFSKLFIKRNSVVDASTTEEKFVDESPQQVRLLENVLTQKLRLRHHFRFLLQITSYLNLAGKPDERFSRLSTFPHFFPLASAPVSLLLFFFLLFNFQEEILNLFFFSF